MFHLVRQFEREIARFYGAPYGIATDSCTHAIELCLRYGGFNNVTIPTHTYISVPMTCNKLGLDWEWKEEQWNDWYLIGNTNIVDAAVLWGPDTYLPGTFMCLSFQYKKHLSLGRGGMILCSDEDAVRALRKRDQNISTMGYHYYMTPEVAKMGIDLLNGRKKFPAKKWSHRDYPNLSNMEVFK
jgi:dTDP-4-amino-4,6-dideoxygalactose transaminase